MVCKSKDSGSDNYRSPSDMEHASETCVFLPTEESTGRRSSRNLSILVLSSERLSIDPEKIPFEISRTSPVIVAKDKDQEIAEGVVPERTKSCCGNYAGIWLTLASGLMFTIGGVIVKYMKDYHPFTLAIFRFQGILIPALFWVLYAHYVQKLPIFEPIWPLTKKEKAKKFMGLILRSVFGSTALFLHFYALQRIDVADALVIGSCQPVFVTITAYFLLGEACGVFPVFAALLSVIGVGVISRPPILTGQEAFDEDALIGAGFSISSMLTATMVFVIIRYLKDVHVSVMTLVLGCWGTLQSIICSVIVGEFTFPHDAYHWALAGALAVITLLGQTGLTLALQCEQAGPVSLVRTADCITAFFLQFLLLGVIPDLYSLIGASIIIFCVILTAFRKWISTLPLSHRARKHLWFVMV